MVVNRKIYWIWMLQFGIDSGKRNSSVFFQLNRHTRGICQSVLFHIFHIHLGNDHVVLCQHFWIL